MDYLFIEKLNNSKIETYIQPINVEPVKIEDVFSINIPLATLFMDPSIKSLVKTYYNNIKKPEADIEHEKTVIFTNIMINISTIVQLNCSYSLYVTDIKPISNVVRQYLEKSTLEETGELFYIFSKVENDLSCVYFN